MAVLPSARVGIELYVELVLIDRNLREDDGRGIVEFSKLCMLGMEELFCVEGYLLKRMDDLNNIVPKYVPIGIYSKHIVHII